MAFRPRRALAVFWKDFLDLRKNVGLLVSMAVLPAVMVLVPIVVVWTYVNTPNSADLRSVAQFYDPTLPLGASAARFLIDKTLTDWFGLFLVMPVFVPILIASQSVAGEKERRTLGPLMPNALWTFGVLVIAPLFAFFGNGVAVLISARVSEARMAQQISALVVLPLVGMVGGQVAGVLKAGLGFYALQGAVVLVLDAVLLVASIRLLDRERLVSRWG